MDCHRCMNIRYDGASYGRCSLPGHRDVVLKRGAGGYNRQICPDFVLRKKCSNCRHWERGEYFADGKTPASKGSCRLRIEGVGAGPCSMWGQGRTKWRKRRIDEREERNQDH